MTDFAMIARRTGGPEVIEQVSIEVPTPGEGEVVVRHRAIGLNFIDAYYRSGLYPADLPLQLGFEAAGRVDAVGPGVNGFVVGQRVAYGTGPLGAYATVRALPAEHLMALPEDITDETAAAGMLKGLTVAFLVDECAKVRRGQRVLVHAAAGGVGSILVPWLVARGAEVIAHAGSQAKAELARRNGASVSLSCPFDELPDAVRAATKGEGVAIVFDGVGAASWAASLASVARRGLIVTYGNASGPVPPIEALALLQAGSVFVTRPTLFDYARTAADRAALARALFGMIRNGLQVPVGQRFALAEAAEAHRRLEARSTTGSTVLLI